MYMIRESWTISRVLPGYHLFIIQMGIIMRRKHEPIGKLLVTFGLATLRCTVNIVVCGLIRN